jgi:hypothetical protein
MTAYFNGTFQVLSNRSQTFDGQFQINSDINLFEKIVYVKFDVFKKSHMDCYDYNIDTDVQIL